MVKNFFLNMHRPFFNFNKEVIFGAIGSAIGAPVFSFIISKFFINPPIISGSAIAGSILGGAVLWISTRISDQRKKKKYGLKKLVKDIEYFTPAAALISLFITYPLLFILSEFFLKKGYYVLLAVILSQVLSFLLFLICINIYRLILIKVKGKKL